MLKTFLLLAYASCVVMQSTDDPGNEDLMSEVPGYTASKIKVYSNYLYADP